MPGVITELEMVFDRPGTYTFYCTRWCGPDHWRMRGTIEVTGSGEAAEREATAPYMTLGIDLDAPHPAQVRPNRTPSAVDGEAIGDGFVDADFLVLDSVRSRSPAGVWQELRADRRLDAISDEGVWDLVAWIWSRSTTSETTEVGRDLFRVNCAACHGEVGDGKGVLATGSAEDVGVKEEVGHRSVAPANFTDPDLLGASPALLHGKILRGGMGTGMPYWGPILTDAQIWALVDYLWSFQFQAGGATASTGTPRLDVDRDTVDLGDVQLGERVEASFVLSNTGDGELVISGTPYVQVVEGCCPPAPIFGARTLDPGQQTTLSIAFVMAGGMGGPHDFRIHFETNDPRWEGRTLTVLSNWVERTGGPTALWSPDAR